MSGCILGFTDVPRATMAASRRLGLAWGVLIALLGLLAGPAAAAPPEEPAAAGADSPPMETVTVETRRALERRIDHYVTAITVPHMDESQERWNNQLGQGYLNIPICFRVLGLDAAYSKFMTERLWQIAKESGALVGDRPDCGPINFLVLMAADPGALLDKLWGKYPRAFDAPHGVEPLKRLIATGGPVRTWYNVADRPSPAHVIVSDAKGGFSRLKWSTHLEIYSVLVTVDAARVKDLTIGQLTDYVAMVGLVRIREDADPGDAPTILSLFSAGTAQQPEGLSSWDRAFLKALYNSDVRSVGHLEWVEDSILRDLTPAH